MTDIPHYWNQAVARRMRRIGKEITPTEVAEARRKTLPYLRLQWSARGEPLPDGELEAVNFMRARCGQRPISESGPGPARCDPIG